MPKAELDYFTSVYSLLRFYDFLVVLIHVQDISIFSSLLKATSFSAKSFVAVTADIMKLPHPVISLTSIVMVSVKKW